MEQERLYSAKNNDHDEIELQVIIAIILKWKKIIIAVTLCSMLLAGIISQYVLERVYQTEIVIAPVVQQVENQSSVNYTIMGDDPEKLLELLQIRGEMDKMVVYEPLDASRFQAVLASNVVIARVIKGLGIEDNIQGQSDRVTVALYNDKDAKSDIYKITVRDKDPEMTVSIAEALVEETNNYMREIKMEQLSKMEEMLNRKLEDSRTGLIIAAEDLHIRQNEINLGIGDDNGSASIEKQVTIAHLQSQVESYQMLVDLINKRLILIKAHKAFTENEDQLRVLSTPRLPDSPVKPNMKVNIAIAGIIGLMISTFIVCLYEWFNDTEARTDLK